MRSFWKGTLSFGLVNIPVRLYTAVESLDPKFHYLHTQCLTPIQYRKFCPTCEREVSAEEIELGTEQNGGWILVTKEELQDLQGNDSHTIAILQFTGAKDVDPIYFSRHYYVEPQPGGEKAYALLRRAMLSEDQAALCRVRLRTKPSLSLLRPHQTQVLVLETMHDPDEIRSAAGLRVPDVEVEAKETLVAQQLIHALMAPFDLTAYRDTYREALYGLIAQKAPVARPEESVRPVDLLEALEASLARTHV